MQEQSVHTSGKEKVEQHLEEQSEMEDDEVKLLKRAKWANEVVVHTLKPSSSMVLSMNTKDFRSLVARTMPELYKEETNICQIQWDIRKQMR